MHFNQKQPLFRVDQPVQLLTQAFNQLTNQPSLVGSGTACLASFSKTTGKLYTANLGDSGFLVIRNTKVVHKSIPQCHYFNAPYQLSIKSADFLNSEIGSRFQSKALTDGPDKADFDEFQCETGDIIILASDGMFDNVHEEQVNLMLERLEVSLEKAKSDTVNTRLSNLFESGYESPRISPSDRSEDDSGYFISSSRSSDSMNDTTSKSKNKCIGPNLNPM